MITADYIARAANQTSAAISAMASTMTTQVGIRGFFSDLGGTLVGGSLSPLLTSSTAATERSSAASVAADSYCSAPPLFNALRTMESSSFGMLEFVALGGGGAEGGGCFPVTIS